MKVEIIKLTSVEDIMKMFKSLLNETPSIKKEKKEVKKVTVPPIEFFIGRLAARRGWRPVKMDYYLGNLNDISPIATFNIILREVAVWLDEKYVDHIEKSEKIYGISPLDGRIHEICKAHIKNYRNFSAFRTIEDAKIACKILKPVIKAMFSNAKSK